MSQDKLTQPLGPVIEPSVIETEEEFVGAGQELDSAQGLSPVPIFSDGTESPVFAGQFIDSEKPEGSRVGNFFKKYKTKLVLGAAAVSLASTLVLDPLGDTTEKVMDAAPWVAGGVGVSEAMFIGGAAMMLASVGDKIGNPLSIKKRIPEIAEKANDSKLFKSGFWVNTTGAVGDFVVLSAGIGANMPPHTWGVLGLTLLDLSVTVAVRKAILNGIKGNLSRGQVIES